MISEADKRILIAQDDWTLAEWHSVLNCFGWPALLPNPEPPKYIPGDRRGQLMDWIWELVGGRLIFRVWNKRMTDAEVDDFWKGTFEKDPAARARYELALQAYTKKMMAQRASGDQNGPPVSA